MAAFRPASHLCCPVWVLNRVCMQRISLSTRLETRFSLADGPSSRTQAQVHSRPTEAWDFMPSCQPGSPRGGPYSRCHLSGPCRERTPCLCLLPVRETINLCGLLLTPEFAQGRRGGKWGGWAPPPRSPLCSAKTEGSVRGRKRQPYRGAQLICEWRLMSIA